MKKVLRISLVLVFVGIIFFGCGAEGISIGSGDRGAECVYKMGERGFVRDWLIAGLFPNPVVSEKLPDGSSHLGFYKDYLESVGGESEALLKRDMEIAFTEENGSEGKAKVISVTAGGNGVVNFDKVFGSQNFKAVYAFCHIYSKKKQEVHFLLGSDDGVKVWVNGELVHSNYVTRGVKRGEDKFSVNLDKGLNRVLLKVIQGDGGWGFVVEVVDAKGYAAIREKEREKEDFLAFLNCRVRPGVGNSWDYTFGPGNFPKIKWEKPYLVEKVMGEKLELDVRWFDSDLNEVKKAAKAGRYGFYAEAKRKNGKVVRRGGTIYCRPKEWFGWSETPRAYLDYEHLPVDGVDREAWEQHREAIAWYAGRMTLLSILRQEEGAVLMSYLSEMEAGGEASPVDTPIIRDGEYHLALKRKLLGVEDKWPGLKMPRKIEGEPARVLRCGTVEEADVKRGTAEKIREICHRWYEESKEAFDILVARHGVVVIHEAFGEGPGGKMTVETPTPMASLTKLITGLMFAQFVDQGLIDIDEPVGNFLPDFPVEGKKAITLRQCFTHTTDLYGHEEFGGLHNVWLENVIANGMDYLEPGTFHNYNGMGYDLAGRVMEVVSGKSVFRLMQENFFMPLGMENTTLEEDLGFSCNSTAWDFGLVGQMMLNKGKYGGREFFSEEVFEQLQPKQLGDFYPGIDVEWGIGITWMRQSHPEAGKEEVSKEATILSKNVIGHGSATSAILRVDMDNDLFIAQTRRRGGKAYEKYLLEVLMAVEDGLVR
jgi:CubicO group peptidase (beta-lactamase class C family)